MAAIPSANVSAERAFIPVRTLADSAEDSVSMIGAPPRCWILVNPLGGDTLTVKYTTGIGQTTYGTFTAYAEIPINMTLNSISVTASTGGTSTWEVRE